ncbi:hypothetical protein Tco_0572243 [Tanacetum coccineum]
MDEDDKSSNLVVVDLHMQCALMDNQVIICFQQMRVRSMHFGEDGDFNFKELSRMIEEKNLRADSGGQEMMWNKLVPKKVNIFVWRALRGRLLVQWILIEEVST